MVASKNYDFQRSVRVFCTHGLTQELRHHRFGQPINETDDGLAVRFASLDYAINAHEAVFEHYDRVRVASSMGHQQLRYRVKLPVVIRRRRIMATFTLSDRSMQVYPVLIGRSTLNGKFVVDVSRGSPLLAEEERRSAELQKNIHEEHV